MTRRPSRIRRPVLVLAVVVVGAAAGLGLDIARAGGLDAWSAARAGYVFLPGPPPYVASGHTVQVDGRAVYLDCRGSGSPTVIFEAGFGAGAGSWGWLLDDTAEVTRACSWDRPGLGQSEARGLHTGLETAGILRAALEAAGEEGPYVVVAHSLGGAYAMLFDSLTSSEIDGVVGLVLLDTWEPLVWIADDPELDAAIRDGHRAVLAQTGAMFQEGEQLAWDATLAELRALPPTEVKTLHLPINMGSKFGDQSQPIPSALAAAWYRVVAEHVPNGRVEVVENSGHVVHFDQHDLVADRIQELVAALRAGTALPTQR